jgi:glycosyltransferase involved in cell wall biosynthesis
MRFAQTDMPSPAHKTMEHASLHTAPTAPLVTVIATCYNHSAFVIESLESIRHQTYAPIQLIITDDRSTDDSDALITEWIARHHVLCTYLRHRSNKGICKTLNEALAHATGKYVALLATDDLWVADKLEHQVRLMEELPEKVGVLYSDAIQIDETGALLPERFIEAHTAESPAEGDIFSRLVVRNFIPAMTTLIRTSCYDTVGRYDEGLCFEDWDMWLRIAQHYHFAFSPRIFAKRRVVSTSMTSTMLHNESPEMLRTYFRLSAKLIKCKSLPFAQTSLIMQRLGWFAERMYQRQYRWRTIHIFKAFLADCRRRTLVMGICSALGMSYTQFCQLLNWMSSVRRALYGGLRDRHMRQTAELIRPDSPSTEVSSSIRQTDERCKRDHRRQVSR